MTRLGQLIQNAPVASALLLAIVLPSLLALTRWPGLIERGVFRPHHFVPQRQWFTAVSSGFLHADGMHLAVNLFSLWAFAFQLEQRMGSLRFALLYGLGILAGNAGTWLAHRHQPGYQTLGASGALLAVLFASVLYFPTQQLVVFPFPMPLPAPLFALAYLAYTWQSARRGGGRVNHDAHFGGALAGVAFVALGDPAVVAQALRAWLG
jgi:membrane associated rhomboid family serine protease